MNCPPTKRLRGLNQDVVTAVASDDPFGDDEEFTQDDFDEIDIIASQAFTSAVAASKPNEPASGSTWTSSAGQNKSAKDDSKENKSGIYQINAGKHSREDLGNMQQERGTNRGDSYRLLEAQHAELKRKLNEVEEEILLKSGEIRVLRDSLKAAQQEKETQRQNQVLLETQRQREQSDREKELNKKVLSLQSELQFKEAEINEMKTKLLSSDKNKTSPKVLSTLTQMHQMSGSSSSSPIGNGFITKETFGAQISSRVTPVKTLRDAADRGVSKRRTGDGQDISHPDPFLSARRAKMQHKGGVLLGVLLQQPLVPSSLGLSHLLSMSVAEYSQLSISPQLHSDPLEGASTVGANRAPLSLVQSLAATGLNLLSQSQTTIAVSNRDNRSCPGAVFLLPLLDLHLSQLCCTLESLGSSSTGIYGSDSTTTSSIPAGQTKSPVLGRLDVAGITGFRVEDTGLTALKLLYLLLAQSDEVVEAVLLRKNQTTGKTDRSDAHMGLCSQNALLQSLLRLCDTRLSGNSAQKEKLFLNALKTLCILMKRTPPTHSDRLQCVLQVVCLCLAQDTRVQTVSECVSVLTAMSDHPTLAKQLCSQHDTCIFLKLFHLIRTRPDTLATHADWILLDLQVVRLLSRVTQRTESWTSSKSSPCQCYSELVQAVVIIFHRQWLDIRGSQEQTSASSSSCWSGPAASLLRESLLLLHWLLLHHTSFSESCRPVLHMYDQMIPAVRETLSKISDLSDSEELALEEICRSDADDTDDMDTDTAS
ncbi:PREDICTED: ATR-interacting protein isoform X1 [Poecilia mexicana]|uniref:ATR interacting protein n=1 Tax=Poecilia mexicana TaxID=48701 RepID=A0A3B3YPZ2_9TELE|nr:PREDICTED: ATR-interacting protein isoform X1 [Poecilia mexicana]XP_014840713.1 PREDICTED: ATR-interacting protein isoform X1 [Poecilia mexicana]